MAVSDRASITVVKDMGLVSNVFDERTLAGLHGDLAIGQTRYSTTGSSKWRNAQPVYRGVDHGEFALGHNGNLVNTRDLAASAGMLPGTVASDSDLVAELLATELRNRSDLGPWEALDIALAEVLPRLSGAFSLVLADRDRIIGVRDPNGFRPLCLGRLDGGWVLASETPALDVVGAHMVRELDPGEVLVVDDTGCRSFHPFRETAVDPRLCLFEFIYFARPDSMLYGQSVHQARVSMGEALAFQAPAEADDAVLLVSFTKAGKQHLLMVRLSIPVRILGIEDVRGRCDKDAFPPDLDPVGKRNSFQEQVGPVKTTIPIGIQQVFYPTAGCPLAIGPERVVAHFNDPE